jgi:hypothetical protein
VKEITVTTTSMRMAKGTCPTCATKINRILGKANTPA